MSDDELERMELMWRQRLPIRVIADELGYTPQGIESAAVRDRKRFPARHASVPRHVRELWLERIRSGRVTELEACEALGVHPQTVRNWLRREGHDAQ